jgi:pyruvate dehydrogenase E1 component beta subunit
VPFDTGAVLASVAKTGHLVVVDEARECCSAASQIAAVVAEQGFALLKGPIRRVTTPNVAIPYAPNAEAHVIPGEARIASAVRELLGRAGRSEKVLA